MCLYITFEKLRASRGFLNSCSTHGSHVDTWGNPVLLDLDWTSELVERICCEKSIWCYIQIRGRNLWKIHPRSVPVPFWGTPHPRYFLQRWGCPTVHFISDLVAAKSLDAELMRTYYSAPRSIRLGPRSGVVVPKGVTWTDVAGRFGAKPAEVQQDPLGTWLIFSWNSRWNLSIQRWVA